MSRNTEARLTASPGTVLVIVSLLALAPVAAVSAAGGTAVGLSPTTDRTEVGETTTFDVVVASASGGVGAYSANITLVDSSVASITNVDVSGDPEIKNVDVSEDGGSVRIEAALMNTSDTGTVTIATITVEGETTGASAVTLSVAELGDEDGNAYTVTDTSDATLNVRIDEDDAVDDDDRGSDDGNPTTDSSTATDGSTADASSDTSTDGPLDTATDRPDEGPSDEETTDRATTEADGPTTGADDSGTDLAAVFLLVLVLAALAAGLTIALRRR